MKKKNPDVNAKHKSNAAHSLSRCCDIVFLSSLAAHFGSTKVTP